MAKKTNKSPGKVPTAKGDDQPATRGMLKLVRNELKEETVQVRLELGQVKQDIAQVRQEMRQDIAQVRQELKKDIAEVKQDIFVVNRNLKHEMSQVKQMVHRSNLLVEEQNANNRIVLEGLQTLWQRQERIEKAME